MGVSESPASRSSGEVLKDINNIKGLYQQYAAAANLLLKKLTSLMDEYQEVQKKEQENNEQASSANSQGNERNKNAIANYRTKIQAGQ